MPLKHALDLIRLQADLAWAGGELVNRVLAEPVLRMIVPRGPGDQPVVTLPGFGGPEFSLAPLNQFLNSYGYIAQSWGLGANKGPMGESYMEELAEEMGAKLAELHETHGKPVALVGQSLGGVYARELARRVPEHVDRVITLGSPAHFKHGGVEGLNRIVRKAVRYSTGQRTRFHVARAYRKFDLDKPPPGVPLVSIYSRLDGVAPADVTAIPTHHEGPDKGVPRENIEILGSHCGMAVNPVALLAIADRLAEDKDAWQPFAPARYAFKPLDFLPKMIYPGASTVRISWASGDKS